MALNKTILRTIDLSSKDINDLVDIFFVSFKKSISSSDLIRKYCSNSIGFSFHCLFHDEHSNLVGSYTFTPRKFTYGSAFIYALHSVDTCFPYEGIAFIIKNSVWQLIQKAKDYVPEISFIYGFPNKSYVKLSSYILEWSKEAELITYIDICPILSLIFDRRKMYNAFERKFKIEYDIRQLKCRYNSSLSGEIKLRHNEAIFLWFARSPFPYQVVSLPFVEAKHIVKVALNQPIQFIRLFIPSISAISCKSKLMPWQINSKLFVFNFYLKSFNSQINIKKISKHINLIWNDVP